MRSNIAFGLICTLKSKKTFKNLKNLWT